MPEPALHARCSSRRTVPGSWTDTLFSFVPITLRSPTRRSLLLFHSLRLLRHRYLPRIFVRFYFSCTARMLSAKCVSHCSMACFHGMIRPHWLRNGSVPKADRWHCLLKPDLLVRLSVTVVCFYSWLSVRLPPSSSRLVRLNGDSTWHNCNRLALGTERTRLVWGDDQSVLSLRICWSRSSKTSKSSVRSSRSPVSTHFSIWEDQQETG